MRVLICGDRNWKSYPTILREVAKLPALSTVIQGGAKGADTIAAMCAKALGLKVEEYPALWELYGRSAGPIRNKQMLTEGKPDEVWAFHTNLSESKGTKDMVRRARKAAILVKVFDKEG